MFRIDLTECQILVKLFLPKLIFCGANLDRGNFKKGNSQQRQTLQVLILVKLILDKLISVEANLNGANLDKLILVSNLTGPIQKG